MSSLLSHNKDEPRITKSLSDSSPGSSAATTKSLRHERLARLSSSGTSEVSHSTPTNHAESYFLRRENRLSARKQAEEETAKNDYKKKGRQGGCGSNMLETEKKESWSLKKRITDMEEQLKVKAELKTENQRLKDENGALIRVITKLSK
ncbi:protein phosphatase 1 regulatory subunit 12B-like isoform X3 [Channa argus]|uniref:protein phosphatase 1 regulatory subunit 12B-like isoform X3 n=1 Tax=Channa argus TaxID=215402 RepID=UPI003520A513